MTLILSKGGEAISWDLRKPVEEQIGGCKFNSALDMLSFEIPVNYSNRDIEQAVGYMNVELGGKGESLYG